MRIQCTLCHLASRLAACVAGAVLTVGLGLPAAWAADDTITPVIVELFTSQGCSSCPPADAVLAALERNQPVPGVVVVPLSEHVDYWNRLGWHDPFSSPRYSARQRTYGDAFGLPNIYTPMMVVDGRTVLVGSDGAAARRAVAAAVTTPKTPIRLEVGVVPASRVIEIDASIGGGRPPETGPAAVWLAITEAGLVTDVMAGENVFRRLRHTGVVRHLERLATVAPETPDAVSMTRRVRIDDAWNRSRLRAVVFLQNVGSRAIEGAAAVAVEPPS